jgi:hypothetical protein
MPLYFRPDIFGRPCRLDARASTIGNVPVTASTPSRLIAGSREDTRSAQMYGVGVGRERKSNLREKEECGVAIPIKTTTPLRRINTNLTGRHYSTTSFVSIARFAVNKVYGVISCTQTQN